MSLDNGAVRKTKMNPSVRGSNKGGKQIQLIKDTLQGSDKQQGTPGEKLRAEKPAKCRMSIASLWYFGFL